MLGTVVLDGIGDGAKDLIVGGAGPWLSDVSGGDKTGGSAEALVVGEERMDSVLNLLSDKGGVDARRVDGERVNGDSGRLNGDGRGEPHDNGDGFLGDVDAGCIHFSFLDVEAFDGSTAYVHGSLYRLLLGICTET